MFKLNFNHGGKPVKHKVTTDLMAVNGITVHLPLVLFATAYVGPGESYCVINSTAGHTGSSQRSLLTLETATLEKQDTFHRGLSVYQNRFEVAVMQVLLLQRFVHSVGVTAENPSFWNHVF